jgi:hypothetical protein
MKNRKIKIGLIATVSGMVAIQGCNVQAVNSSNVSNRNADSIRLEERLRELSNTEYKGKLAWGAMCYKPTVPKYVDYLCPYCGDTIRKYGDWEVRNINQIEEIVKQIKSKGYDIILDKREFCPHCSKESIEKPELIFKIRFSAQANYHVVKSNRVSEYQCLLAFLLGKDKYSGGHDEEYALHDNIAIIQKMTGFGKELKIKKK